MLLLAPMSKMYYVSYETAKNKLNLSTENENSDRITLAYCNQLVKDAMTDQEIDDSENETYIEAIVLKVFNTIQEKQNNQLEAEMVGVYEAVKDALVWC